MSSDGFNKLFGAIFGGVGLFIMILGIIIGIAVEIPLFMAIMIPLGFLFFAIGMGFIIAIISGKKSSNSILNKGTKYVGKIYSYSDDTSVIVNGRLPP